MTAVSKIEELEKHLRRCCEQAYGKSTLVMVSAGTLVEAADLLTRLKPVLEENERLKIRLQEAAEGASYLARTSSIRSNPDGE